jgi:hypothetical protein
MRFAWYADLDKDKIKDPTLKVYIDAHKNKQANIGLIKKYEDYLRVAYFYDLKYERLPKMVDPFEKYTLLPNWAPKEQYEEIYTYINAWYERQNNAV